MRTIRNESWGRILYEPVLDEFEAQVCEDVSFFSVDRPISAGCLVTRRCNLRCQYCYGDDESLPSKEVSAAGWARMFGRLKSWGLMRVDLSGGEPTIRTDIQEIASAALDAELNVVLSTNGLLLATRGLSVFSTEVRLHISLDSGFAGVHEASRVRRDLRASTGSFEQTMVMVSDAVNAGYRVRVMTCIGRHNCRGLVELGERLAMAGVWEWNISRVLAAGRARLTFEEGLWEVDEQAVLEEVDTMRRCYPEMRIRYSNRTEQEGYFLLVLPDGSLATQYTDKRDKVVLGQVETMTVNDLRAHLDFDLGAHAGKWIATTTEWTDVEGEEREEARLVTEPGGIGDTTSAGRFVRSGAGLRGYT